MVRALLMSRLFDAVTFAFLSYFVLLVVVASQAGYEAKEKRFPLSPHCATIFGYKKFIARKPLMGTNNQLLPGGKLILR